MGPQRDLDAEQKQFARQQLEAEDRAQQSASDKAEIKIKLIDNGLLVKTGQSWLAFTSWTEASAFVNARIVALKKKRTVQ